MTFLAGVGRAAYYFFVEDGSIVIGAAVALLVVGVLSVSKPFGSAEQFAGPLLFLLVAALLLVNLLRVAHQARSRR